MFNVVRKEIIWGGDKLSLETGKIARQSDGSVVVTYGKTVILCTVCVSKEQKEGINFLPLTVIYQEKTFAAGKIPGGFFKRETKPSEREVLISRLIDRSLRPLFPDNYHYETQVICTLLSHDLKNEPDMPALVGAAAAIQISSIPFNGPVAGSKVAYVDGRFELNPKINQHSHSKLDLVVAGTEDSILMVESEAYELTEEQMLEAVMFGHSGFLPVINMVKEFAKEVGKEKMTLSDKSDPEINMLVTNFAKSRLEQAFTEVNKQKRREAILQVKQDTLNHLEPSGYDPFLISNILETIESDIVRHAILDKNKRIDGRTTTDIRPILAEVSFLPCTHGSALFTRGETQAIVATTLGTGQDEQIVDSIEGESREHFMLHYNFPPYSVGEVSPMRAPGRREIGHGKLAWRAIRPLMPTKLDFPYTVRLVSEITESNGSSSMATVCGSSLALMDAGVPIERPIAGIAMGLILEKDRFAVLSDILGDEDHLGDMDFKVAGTETGVTALQMDIKVCGITFEIMKQALSQAKQGRLHILNEMNKAIREPRKELSSYAPTITKITIPKDKIRDIIGAGGKVIREICELTSSKIDIQDTGEVLIAATNSKDREFAIKIINSIVFDLVVGEVYYGKVVKLMDFGAFVTFFGSKDGLVHISEISTERVATVDSVLKEGQIVWVKMIGFDRGKIKLSMKNINQETGEELQALPSAGTETSAESA
ncbi:MAG: polyribonucleotide nucleotidyltransferase [Sphingobacteriia bacterium]|nr:polyribonucleotide nucleotidyltransferase [Sphingobacteriia bacterium]